MAEARGLPPRRGAPREGRHRDPEGPAHGDPRGRAREALEALLTGLPDGVTVEADRIEVRFGGPKEAVGRLFALAQALANDYERFEALVGEGEQGGSGGVVTG